MNLEHILERKRKTGNELEPRLVLLFCRGHKGRHHGHSRFDIQVLISANYQGYPVWPVSLMKNGIQQVNE